MGRVGLSGGSSGAAAADLSGRADGRTFDTWARQARPRPLAADSPTPPIEPANSPAIAPTRRPAHAAETMISQSAHTRRSSPTAILRQRPAGPNSLQPNPRAGGPDVGRAAPYFRVGPLRLQKELAARKPPASENAELVAALAELARKVSEVNGAPGEEEFGFFALRLPGGEPATLHKVAAACVRNDQAQAAQLLAEVQELLKSHHRAS